MINTCKRYAYASPDSGVTVEMTLSIEDGAKFGRGEPWGPLPVTDLVTGQVLWVRGAACSAGPRCFCAAEIVDEPVTGGSEVVRLVDEPVTGAPIPPPEFVQVPADLWADNLAAWDGEEDSVKEEHAELIERLNAIS